MKKFLLALAFGFSLMTFGGVQAQEAEPVCSKDAQGYCIELQESIAGVNKIEGKNGIELFSNYIKQIYLYGASIIGIICVLVIVVSGIQISMGGANSEFVNQGKERIMQALLSLILLFASALILRTINPGFFTVGDPGATTFVPYQYEVRV